MNHDKSPAQPADNEVDNNSNLQQVIATIDTLATEKESSYPDVGKGGRFHGLPDYDSHTAPYTSATSIKVRVLTKEGEPPIRTIGTLFYASPDRGTVGYEIHTDGGVLSFTNGEVSGMSKEDDPDKYEEKLQKAQEMLDRRQKEIDTADAWEMHRRATAHVKATVKKKLFENAAKLSRRQDDEFRKSMNEQSGK